MFEPGIIIMLWWVENLLSWQFGTLLLDLDSMSDLNHTLIVHMYRSTVSSEQEILREQGERQNKLNCIHRGGLAVQLF